MMKLFVCTLLTLLFIACSKEAKPEANETMDASAPAQEMSMDSMAVDSAAMMTEETEEDASTEESPK
jgi:uncharacterized protein YcfL